MRLSPGAFGYLGQADFLFGKVVGGFKAGRGDESKIGIAVFAQSPGNQLGMFGFRDFALRLIQYCAAGLQALVIMNCGWRNSSTLGQ